MENLKKKESRLDIFQITLNSLSKDWAVCSNPVLTVSISKMLQSWFVDWVFARQSKKVGCKDYIQFNAHGLMWRDELRLSSCNLNVLNVFFSWRNFVTCILCTLYADFSVGAIISESVLAETRLNWIELVRLDLAQIDAWVVTCEEFLFCQSAPRQGAGTSWQDPNPFRSGIKELLRT